MANRAVFQMDQTKPESKELLRYIRQRCTHAALDRTLRVSHFVFLEVQSQAWNLNFTDPTGTSVKPV